MTLRGKYLNDAIEKELIDMVCDGYETSPITHKSLYERLVNKNIITGSISTLTSRKELIEIYKNKQIEEVGGVFSTSLQIGSKQNKSEILKKNADLRNEVDHAKKQLAENTETLVNIIKAIKTTNAAKNIEEVLSPYLIRELRNKE